VVHRESLIPGQVPFPGTRVLPCGPGLAQGCLTALPAGQVLRAESYPATAQKCTGLIGSIKLGALS
jgi:hypothetical protein